MIGMWFKVIWQSVTMVKPNQVIKLSAIDSQGLRSRLKTEVPFCIDTTVTSGSF